MTFHQLYQHHNTFFRLVQALLILCLIWGGIPALAQLPPDVAVPGEVSAEPIGAGAWPSPEGTMTMSSEDSESSDRAEAPQPYRKLLKGQVTYVVPRGTPIKLKLASVPTTGLRLNDRDLDGNLHPARLNQEVTAKTTEDLYVDDNKVIPAGTLFQGRVVRILPPRRVSRPGSLVLNFDSFTTPDGRKFAFRAEADNVKQSTNKTKAKGFGIIMAHTAGGAIVGALVAYQLFGLENTIALHGYNIAGGAALGALAATTYAVLKHGPRAVLEPGDDLNMEIDSDLLLPAAVEPTAKKPDPHLPGLEIQIDKSKVLKDGLGGYLLRLDALISNNTDKRLNSIDLFVEDDNGTRYPISAGGEETSEVLFEIEPQSLRRVQFNFQIEFPKLKRKLVWLDHRSRRELLTHRLP